MNNIFILVDNPSDWNPYYATESLLPVADYLEHKYTEEPKQIINLSCSYSYNSKGYYCSLLALARHQKVIPTVETINKIETGTGIRMHEDLQKICYQWIKKNNITETIWYLNIYFGTCVEKGLEKIARFIYENYPCPILRIGFNNSKRHQIESIQTLALNQLNEQEQDSFAYALDNFNKKVWKAPRSSRHYRYSLGILHDPEEEFPASDKQAIHRFLEIAKHMNVYAELITEADSARLLEFDALFIRTTTALNHYTFHFAEKAEMNGLVVIDDTESIIKCTNKVYLKELFEKEQIPAPKSRLLFRENVNTFAEISKYLGTPFILKIPDGSFSFGMHKVSNEEELKQALLKMFELSSIVLAQEFIPTEFDWRIGLLNGEPLFACKYYMAKGHWQIYNHDVKGKNLCGPWETVPIYQVPINVIETAIKASSLIGKGLYGVDLKVINDKAVVIEINDNPNIDHDVEDAVLGDEIYYRVISYFVKKLDKLHS